MNEAAASPRPDLSSPDFFCDGNALHARLAAVFGPELAAALPAYLRFKRGQSALAGVRLEWRGGVTTQGAIYFGSAAAIENAAAKTATLRMIAPAAGPAFARLRSPDALFLAFPNDRAIRGLNVVADPRRLKNRLHALGEPFRAEGPRVSGSRSRVEPLRFKPERRAVLRATLAVSGSGRAPATHTWILRAFPPAVFERQRARWAWLAGLHGVNAPRLLAADPERGWLGVEALAGAPLGVEAAIADQDSIAASLRALHAASSLDLPPIRDAEVLAAARATLADLAALMPETAVRAARLFDLAAEAARGLAPAAACPIHGDLKLDQWWRAGRSPALLDWDELAAGDPHLDLASLAADAEARRPGAGFGEPFAREVLGDRFDPARAAWQLALAEIRRARSGLQAAQPDWRTTASRALTRAEAALAGRPRAASRRSVRTTLTLSGLLEATTRAEAAGTDRPLRLTAVWSTPDGPIARLDHEDGSGRPHLWIRFGERIERFPFPLDPELRGLATLSSDSRYACLGHRLFRRATLLDAESGQVVQLRPPRTLAARREKRRSVARQLEASGLVVAAPVAMSNGVHGWREPRLPGAALAASNPESAWLALGETLARVHGTPAPAELAPRAAHEVAKAVEAPLALLLENRVEPGAWIAERLAAAARSLTPETGATLVHGDLHPAQIRLDDRAALLDWDAAHLGEPEEDLGNLLAHLEWAGYGCGSAAWVPLARAYREAGGSLREARVAAYARLSLLRIIAIHAWRDADRPRALDIRRWERWLEEVSCLG